MQQEEKAGMLPAKKRVGRLWEEKDWDAAREHAGILQRKKGWDSPRE